MQVCNQRAWCSLQYADIRVLGTQAVQKTNPEDWRKLISLIDAAIRVAKADSSTSQDVLAELERAQGEACLFPLQVMGPWGSPSYPACTETQNAFLRCCMHWHCSLQKHFHGISSLLCEALIHDICHVNLRVPAFQTRYVDVSILAWES
jgi:hypothetical protein